MTLWSEGSRDREGDLAGNPGLEAKAYGPLLLLLALSRKRLSLIVCVCVAFIWSRVGKPSAHTA